MVRRRQGSLGGVVRVAEVVVGLHWIGEAVGWAATLRGWRSVHEGILETCFGD